MLGVSLRDRAAAAGQGRRPDVLPTGYQRRRLRGIRRPTLEPTGTVINFRRFVVADLILGWRPLVVSSVAKHVPRKVRPARLVRPADAGRAG